MRKILGFTLVEMLLAVFIVSILMAFAIPAYSSYFKNQKALNIKYRLIENYKRSMHEFLQNPIHTMNRLDPNYAWSGFKPFCNQGALYEDDTVLIKCDDNGGSSNYTDSVTGSTVNIPFNEIWNIDLVISATGKGIFNGYIWYILKNGQVLTKQVPTGHKCPNGFNSVGNLCAKNAPLPQTSNYTANSSETICFKRDGGGNCTEPKLAAQMNNCISFSKSGECL